MAYVVILAICWGAVVYQVLWHRSQDRNLDAHNRRMAEKYRSMAENYRQQNRCDD